MASYWHQDLDDLADDEYMKKYLNGILVDKKVVPIPAGDPQKVKQLIKIENINK